MSRDFVMGIDVGSTYVKGVVLDDSREQVAIARIDTPWTSHPQGRTEMESEALLDAVRTILEELSAQLLARVDDSRVVSIGVSGMAEAGVIMTAEDAGAAVVRPIIAWFDPRGDEALATVSAKVADEFGGRTGLPFTSLATFAKLMTLRAEGVDLSGLQWLNVPEFVAHALGGRRRGEVSLVARTGLIDQETGEPWTDALAELGVDDSLLPERLPAGSTWGTASADLPAPLVGARLTVAGHDHLVASVAAGAAHPEILYDSIGTAEALIRTLDEPLGRDARARLAAHGIDTVRHILPDRWVLLAGTRSGLLMRRVLQLAGVHDPVGRAQLDEAVMQLGEIPDGLRVTGGDSLDSFLTVHATSDGLSPAALFAATLRHGSELLLDVVSRMDAEVPTATSTIISGGWAQMACVQRERRDAFPDVTVSDHQEDTAFGAALLAAFCADDSATELTEFVARFCTISPTPESSPV